MFRFAGSFSSPIDYLFRWSYQPKKYLLATNKIGLHLAVGDNLGNDIVIFEKEKVGKLQGKYFDIPPKIVIEVDIKADVSDCWTAISFRNQRSLLPSVSRKYYG